MLFLFIPNPFAYVNTSWWQWSLSTPVYLVSFILFSTTYSLLRASTFLLISTLFLFYIIFTLQLIIRLPNPSCKMEYFYQVPYSFASLSMRHSHCSHHPASHTTAYCNCNPPEPTPHPVHIAIIPSGLQPMLSFHFPHHQHLYNTPFLPAAAALLRLLDPEDEGQWPFEMSKTAHRMSQHHVPEELNLLEASLLRAVNKTCSRFGTGTDL
jgi:hypothetical protein